LIPYFFSRNRNKTATTMSEQAEILLAQLLKKVDSLTQEVKELKVKKFYTVPEFSKATGLSTDTINGYCNAGLLEGTQIKNSGKWLINAQEVERLNRSAKANRTHRTKSKRLTA
jgi:hypothetical protein